MITLAWITLALALGYAAYLATLMAVPYLCMARLEARWLPFFGGYNKIGHARRPSHKSRSIVQPNPDVFNSTCCYDLSKGPVRFRGPVPDDYWSLSLFAQNSDNYFVVNDRALPAKVYDILVHARGERPPESELAGATHVVESPTTKGVMLIRMFVRDHGAETGLRAIQDQTLCLAP